MASDAKKILIVDDDPDVAEMVRYNLNSKDYHVKVLNDPLKILGVARQFEPHLFILDVMMPGIDGIQICRMLRADPLFKEVSVIFLTAREDKEARIKGLESGADDYIAKPFDMKELLLRVGSLLRRTELTPKQIPETIITIGGITLEESRHRVTLDDKEVRFTATEFRLLQLLMKRKGRVQTRDNLLLNIWDYEADIETRTVDTHIRRLRKKLGSSADLIETIRGVGYRFVEKPEAVRPFRVSISSPPSRYQRPRTLQKSK